MVEVFFGTNRNILEDGRTFGNRFNAAGPSMVRFGSATVEDWPAGGPLEPYQVTDYTIAQELRSDNQGFIKLGSEEVFNKMREQMRAGQDALLFLHGYASDFETPLTRAAELAVKYASPGRPLVPFVFSWPSDGEMIPFYSYFSDVDDAVASGPAIARAFVKFLDFLQELEEEMQCKQRLHLVAHSMGNFVLQCALTAIIDLDDRRLGQVFENVFLMAADVDEDALDLDWKLGILPKLATRVHIYYSGDDRALLVSDWTKVHDAERLGIAGPRGYSGPIGSVVFVDCSDVDEQWSELTAHQYYRCNEKVVEVVRQVIAGVRPDRVEGRGVRQMERCYFIRNESTPDRSGARKSTRVEGPSLGRSGPGRRRTGPRSPNGRFPAG